MPVLLNGDSHTANDSFLPKTAIYTVNTHGSGTFKGWLTTESAVAFITQSAYCSSEHFERVVLYTDSFGELLLRNAPFDEVQVTMNGFDVDPAVKGASKLDSYSRQKEPFIHMDWDFILWNMKEDRFRGPVLGQSRIVDYGKSAVSLIWKSIPWKPKFIEGYIEENTQIDLVCPSIFGGMDVEFLNWYAELALEILRHPKNRFIQEFAQGELSETVSVAIEQWLLGACALHTGTPINYLCTEPTHHIRSAELSTVRRYGFTHLGGQAKCSDEWMKRIQECNRRIGLSDNKSPTRYQSKKPASFIDFERIPYKVLISLERQRERRENAQRQFAQLGFDVEWKIPVKYDPASDNIAALGYNGNAVAISQALTLLEILDEAERRSVESLMIFEDDVIFHPAFLDRMSEIKVPDDWKFIYLGGRNCGGTEYISSDLIKSDFVVDLHAVIIRTSILDNLRQVLMDPCINSVWTDFRFATLQNRFPAYLCRPNLAWQSYHADDLGNGPAYSHYNEDGSVKEGMES